MAYKTDISADVIRQFLDYEPDTGAFTWRRRDPRSFASLMAGRCWNTKFTGKVAGYVSPTGYRRIVIEGKARLAHRLAMTLALNCAPDGEIDHINGNRDDNRIDNLRVVTVTENRQNCRMPHDNTSGVFGVNAHNGSFRAFVGVAGKSIHLGSYKTQAEARAARKAALIVLKFHPNHGRAPIR